MSMRKWPSRSADISGAIRQPMVLCLIGLLLLAGQEGNAGDAAAGTPEPGRWQGRFSNNLGEAGTLTVDMERKDGAWSGVGGSVDDNGVQGVPLSFTRGQRVGGNFVLSGEISIPAQGGAPIPGRIAMTGVARGGAWSGAYAITVEAMGLTVNGKFDLKRIGGTTAPPPITPGGGKPTPPTPDPGGGDTPSPGPGGFPSIAAGALTRTSRPFAPGGQETVAIDAVWRMPYAAQTLLPGWSGEYEILHLPEADYDVIATMRKPADGFYVRSYPKVKLCHITGQGQLDPATMQAIRNSRSNQPRRASEIARLFLNYRRAQNVKVVETEDKSAEVKAQIAPAKAILPRPYNSGGYHISSDMDADRVIATVEYEEGGRILQEQIGVTVIYFTTNIAIATNVMNLRLNQCDWNYKVTIVGGPKGKEKARDGEFQAITESLRRAPEWQARLRREQQAYNQAKTNSVQSAIAAQNRAWRAQQDAINARNATQNQAFNDMTDAIVGRERVRNPFGAGELKIDYTKNHAWVDRNGGVIYNDDHSYNPNRDPNIRGEYLQVR